MAGSSRRRKRRSEGISRRTARSENWLRNFAKVGVAGSNPVVRSSKVPGQGPKRAPDPRLGRVPTVSGEVVVATTTSLGVSWSLGGRKRSGVAGCSRTWGIMNKAVTWSRALSLTLLLGATSFIPGRPAWASASSGIRAEESSEPCPKGQERHKSGHCEPPCPRGQLRHPAGYCTCGVAVGDAASTMASCVEAIQGM